MLQSDWHKKEFQHKDGRHAPVHHEQALLTRQLANPAHSLALQRSQMLRFIAAHKRRPQNRSYLSQGCAEVLW
jgi:hypothetical protein